MRILRRYKLIAGDAESIKKQYSQRLYCFAKMRRTLTIGVITVKGAA